MGILGSLQPQGSDGAVSGQVDCPDCRSKRVLIVLKPQMHMGRCPDCGSLWVQKGSGPSRQIRGQDLITALIAAADAADVAMSESIA